MIKYGVALDGVVVSELRCNTQLEATAELHRLQPQSAQWAMEHEGWSIVPLSRIGGMEPDNYGVDIGMTSDGTTIRATISLRVIEPDTERETVDHVTIGPGVLELSATYMEYEGKPRARIADSRIRGFGAGLPEALTRVQRPLNYGLINDVKTLSEWHLNAMQAACANQTVVWEDSPYGKRPSLTQTKPCKLTGYRYGTKWLVKRLPARIVNIAADVIAKQQ